MTDYMILGGIIVAASIVLWFLARHDKHMSAARSGLQIDKEASR